MAVVSSNQRNKGSQFLSVRIWAVILSELVSNIHSSHVVIVVVDDAAVQLQYSTVVEDRLQ